MQDDQGMMVYIENWFHPIIKLEDDSLLQLFYVLDHKYLFFPQIHPDIQVHPPYVDMSMILIMLRTWFHWKFSNN